MFSRVHSDKENMSNIQLKNADSTRKHQSRKQIFGEIRNTIHNQAFATPLKQEIRTPKPNTSNHVSNSINRNDVKQCKSKVPEKNKCDISSFNMSYSNLLDEIELLYYFDFRGYCCVKPRKNEIFVFDRIILDVELKFNTDLPRTSEYLSFSKKASRYFKLR